ncbi:hypothetical protein [Senegalia massiliensis]|uniref:Uncharacterized protein n=1 Tax=Senegalia massiliensis TaxID=1720316 RepID=A0A845QZN2_9CLOT|nr:hypothetical protein [Senegalia massiliensis]NBI07630.1 hypothetical protein [Senegalia massiliensis]
MKNNYVQNYQMDFIKTDILNMKISETKGNKDKYFYELLPILEEKLKTIEGHAVSDINSFKNSILSYVFSNCISKGIHREMTVEQMYQYEYKKSGMDKKGIILNGKYFYEGSYIALKQYLGNIELYVKSISNNSIIIEHRFNADIFLKEYKTIESLENDMWSKKDIEDLFKIELSKVDEKKLIYLNRLLWKVNVNFDKQFISKVNMFAEKVTKESRARAKKIANSLSEHELMDYISKSLYNRLWDKDIFDNKKECINKLKYQFSLSGQTLIDPLYNHFSIGFLNFDNSKLSITLKSENSREFDYSYSKLYEYIKKYNHNNNQISFSHYLM